MAPGEGNAPSSGLRFRDLTGFSTQSDGKPTGHVKRNHRASPPGVGGPVKHRFNRCQACGWRCQGQPYTIPALHAVLDVAASCTPEASGRMRLPWPQPAGYLMKGLEQRSPNSHEEVLPYPDRGRCVGGIDGGHDAGTGNGQALARPQAGVPRRGEEKSRVAARPPSCRPLQDTALLVAPLILPTPAHS